MSWTRGCASCWRWRPARSRWRRCAGGSGSAGSTATSGSTRWRAEGVAGLADRSRAPLHHPQAVAAELAEACLDVRRAHPTWGPVKVRAWLERKRPSGAPWPAASTIGALFDREGLTVKRRLRRRGPPGGPLFAADAANDVWTIDFKGWFRTGDGTRVDPLTLSDACSRYLLRCQAVARPDTEHVWPILDAAFREYGLPLRLRSDNGPALRDHRRGRAVAACGAGDQGRGHARAHPPRQAAGERPARAAAPDAAAGHRQPAGRDPAGAAGAVPAGSRPTTTRSGRTPPSTTPRPPTATPPRRGAGTACCARPSPTPTRRSARCAATARSSGAVRCIHVERGADRRAGRPRRDRGRPLDGRATARSCSASSTHRGDRLKRPRKGADGLVDNAARCPQGPQPQQQQPPGT